MGDLQHPLCEPILFVGKSRSEALDEDQLVGERSGIRLPSPCACELGDPRRGLAQYCDGQALEVTARLGVQRCARVAAAERASCARSAASMALPCTKAVRFAR